MTKGWTSGIWRYRGRDSEGRIVDVQIAYNPATLAITNPGLTGNREVGCTFSAVQFGRPDTGTIRTFPIPVGDFSVGRQQLGNQGFDTIDQVADANVTLVVA